MSPDQHIGLKGYRVIRYQSKPKLRIKAEPLARPECCPCCGGDRLHSKGRYRRRVRHLESFGDESTLIIHCRRYYCLSCRKSFVQPLEGIRPGRHSTEPFRRGVYQLHHDGICGSRVAERSELGHATVERIYQEQTERKASERQQLECPLELGIDEHTLHKKCRFATTFCDLRNHSVFDVVEGKSAATLETFLQSLQGRERVRLVCIDLSSSYRSLIKRYFPNARIVADRFHVVRLMQHHFMELFRQIAPEIKQQRGYLAALRKRPGTLTRQQQERLRWLFTRYPAIGVLHRKMQKLWKLLSIKHRNAQQCRPIIKRFLTLIEELANSGFAPLATLARTLHSWQEEIACMWRFTKNNGITEGFHRKMKLIQRRAYGFRNFNNYRLRVIAQCGPSKHT